MTIFYVHNNLIKQNSAFQNCVLATFELLKPDVIEFIQNGIRKLIKMHCSETLKNNFFDYLDFYEPTWKQKVGGPIFSIKYLEKPNFVCF